MEPFIAHDPSALKSATTLEEPKPFPRRRFVLELKMGADDREAMIRELEQIALEMRRGFYSSNVTSGGYSAGFWLTVTEDPTVTHDSYFEAIKDL